MYGKAPSSVQMPYIFNVKTSLKFLGSEEGYLYSGNPGYIKGKPILIGTRKDGIVPNTFQGVTYNLAGFPLKGANNDGKCYFLREAINKDD